MICFDRNGHKYNSSSYLITSRMVTECVEDIKKGGNPDDYHPRLLFYAQLRLYKAGQMALVKTIAACSKKRKEAWEWDNLENWNRKPVKYGDTLL